MCLHIEIKEVERIDCGRHFYVLYECAWCSFEYHSIEPKESDL